MKLKLLFCQCVKKIVDSYKEGIHITSMESLIDAKSFPSFLIEKMDSALKTVAHKILTHSAITKIHHEELIKDMETKSATSGLKLFVTAIENTGLECTEIISFIESQDIINKKEEFQLANVPVSEPQSTHHVTKGISLDTLKDLEIFKPDSVLEKSQLQPGDVNKTEVIPSHSYHNNKYMFK